ncbi:MAG: DUF2380 domain-containing protein [Gemmatimonadales bacterium]
MRSAREKADARVAAFEVALYTAQANLQEASDSAKADVATSVLQTKLAELLPGQLVDPAAIRSAIRPPGSLPGAQRQPCNVIVACARAVAGATGARWVVMAKVSKTSNLIWLFTGQLIHVPSGTIILDDSTELKGEPEAMVRAGTRIFAERVARTVRAGGVTTDFPEVP